VIQVRHPCRREYRHLPSGGRKLRRSRRGGPGRSRGLDRPV